MATRREIKRRIKSTRSMAQITKAMQMVSAAKMRRAQQRVQQSRPYAEQLRGIVADVGGRPGVQAHPLLAQRDVKAIEIVTISPDGGLAGGLVTNLNRETTRTKNKHEGNPRIVAVGKKGRDFAVRSHFDLISEFTKLGDAPGADKVGPVAQQVLDDFQEGKADIVYLVYTKFISTLRQRPQTEQLLPVVPPEKDENISGNWDFEPDNPEEVLSLLLPRYVEFSIYQALLESLASEHSARMIAMSNATENALDLIKDLSLLANKARQAEITKEIAEISGAAEALRTG
ncbi:MAG TPA: ATP synthase F1 subunit gamma [Chloroflexi bacterium]|nr:ATP synthase F1 subunit gamma [Chloroflexota bacterium]